MKQFIRSELEEIHQANIRLKIIGDHHAFEPEAAKMVDEAVTEDGRQYRVDAGAWRSTTARRTNWRARCASWASR